MLPIIRSNGSVGATIAVSCIVVGCCLLSSGSNDMYSCIVNFDKNVDLSPSSISVVVGEKRERAGSSRSAIASVMKLEAPVSNKATVAVRSCELTETDTDAMGWTSVGTRVRSSHALLEG